MSKKLISRDPETGALNDEWTRAIEARARQLASERGTTALQCYGDAYTQMGKERADLHEEHVLLMDAQSDSYAMAELQAQRPDLYAALAECERVDHFAARQAAAAPAPFLAFTERVLSERFGGDRAQYGAAATLAAQQQPEMYRAHRNGATAPEAFIATGAYPDMDELSKIARELLRKIAAANGETVDEGKLGRMFADADAVKAFMKRFDNEVAGVRVGPGGELIPVTNAERNSARVGNPDRYSSLQSAGTWSEPFAAYVEGQPFRIMPLGTFMRDGRKLDLTAARLKAIAANYEQGIPRWKAPIYAGHPTDDKSDPPALGHIAKLEYRNGQGLYAFPLFTEEGAKLAQSGAYLYNSPGILWELNGGGYTDEAGNKVSGGALDHVALTAKPFFGLGNTLEQ